MELFDKLKKIRAFVLDVDGVLTDGTLLILDDGTMLRQMNIKDGYALVMAVKNNYKFCVISGSTSEGVELRLQNLGIHEIHFGQEHKLFTMQTFVLQNALSIEEVLYMGDDLIDIPPMKKAGLAVCPADAVSEVREIAHYVTQAKGGFGAVREIIELVMKAQGKWTIPKQ